MPRARRSRKSVEDIVFQCVSRQIEIPRSSLSLKGRLEKDYGCDSLDYVVFTGLIEDKLDILIDEDDIREVQTLEQLVGLCKKELSNGRG